MRFISTSQIESLPFLSRLSEAMDLLTTSPSRSLSRIPTLFPKQPISSFNPKTPFSQFRRTPISRVLSTASPNPSNFESHLQKPTITFQLSSPQTPERAMRGAESDTMGLLLRERIVFLGNEIDDFVADAIVSQLLLLDAQDPKKDIKLFINSPGGSLRLDKVFFFFHCLCRFWMLARYFLDLDKGLWELLELYLRRWIWKIRF